MFDKKPFYGIPGEEYETMCAKMASKNGVSYTEIARNSSVGGEIEACNNRSATTSYSINNSRDITVGNEYDAVEWQGSNLYNTHNQERYGTVSNEYKKMAEKQDRIATLRKTYQFLPSIIQKQTPEERTCLVNNTLDRIESMMKFGTPYTEDLMLIYYLYEQDKEIKTAKEYMNWVLEIEKEKEKKLHQSQKHR